MRKYQFISMMALALTVALSVAACGMGNSQNGVNSEIDDMDHRFNRTSRLEEANQNLIESVKEAATAIHDGLMELSTMRR